MKLLIVNNLSSGLSDGSIYDFIRTFSQDGDEIVLRSTAGNTDLRTFLHDAEKFDCVIAAGGDGTIATITHMLAETGIPVLPYPAGTANLLALNLYSPSEPHALVDLVRSFQTMDFDIGEIETSDGSRLGFSIMAGAGYDAAIMKNAEQNKKLFGQMAYFASAINNPTPQFSSIRMDIDGKQIETSGVGILLINFSKIQFDIKVVHQNEPRDGYFDIVVLHTKDAFGLIPTLVAAVIDGRVDFPNRFDSVQIYRGKEVIVEADPPLPIQFDGEVSDHTTPFKAKILPKMARFVVSQECIKQYS